MLFNGQNKKFVDPRYFLHEAPADPAQPAPTAPAAPAAQPKQVAYDNQGQLARQSVKQRAYSACDFAVTVQKLILSKVNITNPTLKRKLSDGKFGYVTASLVNFILNYAKQQGKDIGNLTPIPLTKVGYAQACAFKADQIQKFQELFASVPAQNIQKVVNDAAAKDTFVPKYSQQEVAGHSQAIKKALDAYGLKLINQKVVKDPYATTGSGEALSVTIQDSNGKTYQGTAGAMGETQFSQASDIVKKEKVDQAIADAIAKIPMEEKENLRRQRLAKPAAQAEPSPSTGPVQPSAQGGAAQEEQPQRKGDAITYKGGTFNVPTNATYLRGPGQNYTIKYMDGKRAVVPKEEYDRVDAIRDPGEAMEASAQLAKRYYQQAR